MQQSSQTDGGAAPVPWRVLIVDDETAITEEIAEYLAGRGIGFGAAGEAAAALATVRSDPSIMVMITGVRMPGTDGVALAAQALDGRSDDQALEVVILTGPGVRGRA
jgi:DNA-binding NtrC family response regulator